MVSSTISVPQVSHVPVVRFIIHFDLPRAWTGKSRLLFLMLVYFYSCTLVQLLSRNRPRWSWWPLRLLSSLYVHLSKNSDTVWPFFWDFSKEDLRSRIRTIREGKSINEHRREEREINEIQVYCENTSVCRRVQLLQHWRNFWHEGLFEAVRQLCLNSTRSKISPRRVGGSSLLCDTAKHGDDVTVKFKQCLAIFKGSDTKEICQKKRNKNPTYGARSTLSTEVAKTIFFELIRTEALIEQPIRKHRDHPPHYYLKVTHWVILINFVRSVHTPTIFWLGHWNWPWMFHHRPLVENVDSSRMTEDMAGSFGFDDILDEQDNIEDLRKRMWNIITPFEWPFTNVLNFIVIP